MPVYNVHARRFPVPGAGELLDDVTERLWPAQDWPPMEFAGPLAPGTPGGHGPVRYVVESFHAGQSLRCRFTAPQGIDGFHEFLVRETDGGCELEHVLAARLHGAARITWPLFWRPMHDAVLEQVLDGAELALTGEIQHPVRWSPYVRLLRAIGRRVVSRITGSRGQEPRVKLRA
ncbi:SRPBCC family protein [Amycolatopsis sp. NPDC051903]|uniref:SRPBCC family protein n=1 Tax=Amycolatopsis sp. NPDC051903 TaxID=3363936 RepID=UPI0037A322A1